MWTCTAGGNAAAGKFIWIFTQLNEYAPPPLPPSLGLEPTPEIHLIIIEIREERTEK